MDSSNLIGTISSEIGAFVDMESFNVARSNLTGGLPASMSAWKKLKYFSVRDCHLDGALPALNYHAMTGPDPDWPSCILCSATLFDNAGCLRNAFSCPLPQGVTDMCSKFTGRMPRDFLPITNADCYNTTSSQ